MGYMMPLVLICGLYSVMIHRLWNQAPGGRASAESIKNKKRVIKLVLAVVIMFALCWLPIQTILVLRSLKLYSNTPISVAFQIISHILAYSNSCVNPILYAFLSQPFRRGFWAVITCIRPSGPHGLHQNGQEMAIRQNKGGVAGANHRLDNKSNKPEEKAKLLNGKGAEIGTQTPRSANQRAEAQEDLKPQTRNEQPSNNNMAEQV